MKRFDLKGVKGVLSGLRGAEKSQTKQELVVSETLSPSDFYCAKVARHGFPYHPSALAWDPVQKLLAIGTRSGHIKIMGKPGVDYHIQHEKEQAVTQIVFLINEGALISACADNSVHLWNYRQKVPEIVNSLKFNKEKITQLHLPYQARWLYIGTERGNIHVVNIESFTLSGYIINWNKCIDMSQKSHPGSVVHLSDCPLDSNKLLIGYATGLVVLWDLKLKTPESRFQSAEPLRDVEWHHEGRQFMCAHADGTLATWNTKNPQRPCSVTMPHQRSTGEDCKPITRLQWKSMKNGEPYVIFTGGLSTARQGKVPSLTLMHGRSTTVLELEHKVVDFLVLCNCVWPHEYSDPYAIVVLLSSDLVLIDLTTPGYPIFENPYPMDLHDSPVTTMAYYSDCASDLIPAFYSCGMKQKRKEFSQKTFPIGGGVWGTTSCSYSELVISGHADGSVKFWDSSGVTLQYLYKLKSSRLFERPASTEVAEMLAVRHIFLEEESRLIVLGCAHHVVVFDFNKKDAQIDVPRLDISPSSEPPSDDHTFFPSESDTSATTGDKTTGDGHSSIPSLQHKRGARLWPAGYQPTLVASLLPPPAVAADGQQASAADTWRMVTAVCLNSSYGLLAVGTSTSLFVVDMVQKTVIMNVGVPELFGTGEALKTARSPMVTKKSFDEGSTGDPKSPPPTGGDQPACQHQPLKPATKPVPPIQGLQAPSPIGSIAAPTDASGVSLSDMADQTTDTTTTQPVKPPRKSKQERAAAKAAAAAKIRHTSGGNKLSATGEKVDQVSCNLTGENSNCSESGEALRILPSITIDQFPTSPRGPTGHQPLSKTRSDPTERSPRNSYNNLDQLQPLVQQVVFEGTALGTTADAKTGLPSNGQATNTGITDTNLLPQMSAYSPREPSPRDPSLSTRNNNGLSSTSNSADKSLSSSGGGGGGVLSRMRRFSTRIGLTSSKKWGPSGGSSNHLGQQCGGSPRSRWFVDLDSEDKPEGGGISQSSSVSSIDHVGVVERVQCLVFADAFARRIDHDTAPSLWVGTDAGNTIVVLLNIPAAGEMRMKSSVILNPSGSVFRAKGAVMEISFLNYRGLLIPSEAEVWQDKEKEVLHKKGPAKDNGGGKEKRLVSRLSRSHLMSTSGSVTSDLPPGALPIPRDTAADVTADQQMVVIGTDVQVYLMAMPSQTVMHRLKFPEDKPCINMEAIVVKESVCLACLSVTGHVSLYSLPSLRPLLEHVSIGACDSYAAKTWRVGNHGHALFMCSPFELTKLTLSADMCRQVNDMMGDLFSPKENPECPKASFLKALFSPALAILDRAELFGDESGKASSSVAQRIPGSSLLQAQQSSATATSEISRARQALDERGEKLSQLDDRTAQLRSNAEEFAGTAHKIASQYSQKKWYHL